MWAGAIHGALVCARQSRRQTIHHSYTRIYFCIHIVQLLLIRITPPLPSPSPLSLLEGADPLEISRPSYSDFAPR